MKSKSIFDLLSNWVSIETWHTGHPRDDHRFHTSLHNIIESFGTNFSLEVFETSLLQLLDEHHPTWEAEHKEILINKFTSRAEVIRDYLEDIKQL